MQTITLPVFGYGSREWMMGIVHNPEHERFYGSKNDRMPAFGRMKLTANKSSGLSIAPGE